MTKQFSILSGILLLACVLASAQESDDGKVLYLTKLGSSSLRLKVLRDTPLNLTRASNTYMTFLPRGQIVDVLAIAKYQLQVHGRMSTGAVQGWVNRADIAPITDEVMSGLEQKMKAQQELDDAIKRKEVIFDMTQDQVLMILGKPADKTRIQEEEGTEEVWTYYSYKSVPFMQSFGYGTNSYTQVVTQKVRTGSKIISFKDGKVVRIEQKTEQPAGVQQPYGYPMAPVVIPKSAY